MPRGSKRKQHLAKIAPLVVEGNKRRKNIRQIEKDRAFQLRQQEEDDFWDEYESDFMRNSSSDESSSDGEEEKENNDHAYEGKHEETDISRPGLSVFHSGSGDYLRAVRGTGSLSTEKRERHRIRELEKAASNSLSIKTMFKTQQLCTSQDKSPNENPASQFLDEEDKEEVCNKETIQAKAVHDLSELMRLKTEQLKRYGAVLIPQSNLYLRHQMVQSFLWMQLRKKTDNPGITRRTLATMVAQRFNRGGYTGRRIIKWEKKWITTGKISSTKARKNKHILS